MFKIKFSFFIIVMVILFTSCQKESSNLSEFQSVASTDLLLTKPQVNVLLANGINPLQGEKVTKLSTEIFGQQVDGIATSDYFLSYEQIDDMVQDGSGKRSKLYATTNRINLPQYGKRTIRVGGVINGIDGLNNQQLLALSSAVRQYNNLFLKKLRFQFVTITEAEANNGRDNRGPIDIIAFTDSRDNFVRDADGRATFPANGNPGPFFGIDVNTRNFTLKNNTILIMHEMGHTLGMAHADFRTRRTCGNVQPLDPVLGDLLGVQNVTGVCQIPGTDASGDFENSIMRACGFFVFRSASFTSEDRRAFKRLYAQVESPCDQSPQVNVNVNCKNLSQANRDYIIRYYGAETLAYYIQIGVICP